MPPFDCTVLSILSKIFLTCLVRIGLRRACKQMRFLTGRILSETELHAQMAVSFPAMAEVFFSRYCLVKNTLPQKVFFKFFIYPKLSKMHCGSVSIFLNCLNFLMVSKKKLSEYRAGTEILTKYVVKSMNLSIQLHIG